MSNPSDVWNWLRLFSGALLFTLLIVFFYFMIVLPMRPDVPAFVDVPTAQLPSTTQERDDDLTISIASDGATYLALAPVAGAEELMHRLLRARRGRSEPPVVRIRADRAASFRHVRQAVRAARDAGFTRVTFSVRREERSFDVDFFQLVPDPGPPNPWPVVAFAAACLGAALAIRFARRSRSSKPGCAGWLFLVLAALALFFLWELYFPSCPPGMWC